MGRKNGWDAGAASAVGEGGGWRDDGFVERRDGSSRHLALEGGPFGMLPCPETQQGWSWWEPSVVKIAAFPPLLLPPPPPLRLRPRRVSPCHELLSISLSFFPTKKKTKQKQKILLRISEL
jgi:hypothetical protein